MQTKQERSGSLIFTTKFLNTKIIKDEPIPQKIPEITATAILKKNALSIRPVDNKKMPKIPGLIKKGRAIILGRKIANDPERAINEQEIV